MKIEYKFVTGERVYVDVNKEFEKIMLKLNNELNNNNRKETRRHESLNLFDKNEKNVDTTTDVFENVSKNLDKDKLYIAIAKLKPNEQELMYKLYLNNFPMTQAEYSKKLNVSHAVLRKRTERIRKKLSNILKSCG